MINLCLTLLGGVLSGLVLGRTLPKVASHYLGQFLFWVGVPVTIVAFTRRAELSTALWMAPAAAWIAILIGTGITWSLKNRPTWPPSTQASFVLSAMVGNTGYLGYPIALALAGPAYFAWALFYDILGTMLGAYTLGIVIAAYFSRSPHHQGWLVRALLRNPALWSFGIGLWARNWNLPPLASQTLQGLAWVMVPLSLVLIGMRLAQVSSWKNFDRALISLAIKMLLVPGLIGIGLTLAGIPEIPKLIIVLQSGMPPAFATLILAEAYRLDLDLTVTALTVGSLGLVITLPLWLTLLGGWG
ncbi:transporter [Leptolyngbya sp. 'hensonii']|uniref:AEC family transporter n=1 Tax=Leptolyngbya sp. 'hensonii' TaxID=1922337 RepID=UPI00094FA6CE|nr:AEC family transporter [Leptolyngbya sp. 'hensonii']OLP19047.1 transporter [Leptolyngbya sp. 'hensonii']